MKQTVCDMCGCKVESNLVFDSQSSKSYAGYPVTVELRISTQGDFCRECLSGTILREVIQPGVVKS